MQFTSLAGITGNYRITLDGGDPAVVRVIAADVIRWEQINNKSFFSGDVSFSRIAFIAWAAMKRQGLTELEFTGFLTSLEDLESENKDEAQDDADEDSETELPGPTSEGFTV